MIEDSELAQAEDAMGQGDYSRAYPLLLASAEAGNAKARAYLGVVLQNGLAGEQDLIEAVRWLKLAVDGGIGDAAHNLGTLYAMGGPGVPADFDESRRWYRKAKALGFVVANDPDWFEKGVERPKTDDE